MQVEDRVCEGSSAFDKAAGGRKGGREEFVGPVIEEEWQVGLVPICNEAMALSLTLRCIL